MFSENVCIYVAEESYCKLKKTPQTFDLCNEVISN